MISINPAPTISVAVTEQDLNFETRLNPIETPFSNSIFGNIYFSKHSFEQVPKKEIIEDV